MPVNGADGGASAAMERLYGVGLDEFVAARTAAARELREQGRRDEAAAVQALRKPSVAAWIVNRLARDEEELVAELLAAGARIREVQLGAGSPAELRSASEAEQAALDALMRVAARVAAAARSGGGSLERVRETLRAAAVDPDLAELVRRGVLVREQQAVGFPLGAAVPAASRRRSVRPSPAPVARAPDHRRSPGRSAAVTRRVEQAVAAAKSAQEALAEAERGLADARAAHEAAG
ncbi:MAG TPA: hypothetical protein VFW18_02630, partial [Gaiellales bacterium]|nr:hypothetical protein [Gaiellales bacterium]